MGSFKKLENDFTGGQVSPLLNKRSNAKRHDIGLKTLQNMTIMLQGGVTSRPSTEHVAQVKDSSKTTRLLPFEFSTEETYAIEMGDLYFRFLKESGQILQIAEISSHLIRRTFPEYPVNADHQPKTANKAQQRGYNHRG